MPHRALNGSWEIKMDKAELLMRAGFFKINQIGTAEVVPPPPPPPGGGGPERLEIRL